MKSAVIRKAVAMITVAFAGSFGTWVLTTVPEVHTAFCGGA